MRTKVIAGNWKMNTERATAESLARAVAHGVAPMDLSSTTVLLCPPSVFLPVVEDIIASSQLQLGAQDVNDHASGAFTGEVSVGMLKSVGCTHAIVGHSERRLMMGESDDIVSRKANATQHGGLTPIVCIGETAAEREAGETLAVLRLQVHASLNGFFEFNVAGCVIAYEPVWAIGTGNTATPEQAQEAHAYVRSLVAEFFSDEAAAAVRIIYGGSVTADNAAALFAQPDVDGGLVGGASLDAASFLRIVGAAL